MKYVLAINWDKYRELDDDLLVSSCIRTGKCASGERLWHGYYEDGYTPYIYETNKEMTQDLKDLTFNMEEIFREGLHGGLNPLVRMATLVKMNRKEK